MDDSTPAGTPLAGLARDVRLGQRTLPLDVWLVLGTCASMVLLCAWAATQLLRPAFELLPHGEFGFVLGWALLVLGIAFGTLGYAYFWVGARALVRDPVGRWAGVVLGGTLGLALLLDQDKGVHGTLFTLILLANLALALLCALGPGISRGQRAGRYAAVPLPLALSLVLCRAEATAVIFAGVSIVPAGKYETKDYLLGVALVGLGVAVVAAARRLLEGRARAAYLVVGLASANAVLGLVSEQSQLTLGNAGLAAVIVWGTVLAPQTRAFYGLAPLAQAAGGASSTTWQAPAGSAPAAPANWTPGAVAPPLGLQPLAIQLPPPPPAVVPAPPLLISETPLVDALAEPPAPIPSYVEPVAADPVTTEVDEATVARPPALPPAAVTLLVDDHPPLAIDRAVVIGRAPTAPPHEPHAVPAPLLDPEKSLSRSHAVLRPGPEPGQVLVEDLDSVNGTFLLPPGGGSERLTPGQTVSVPVGTSVMFGALRATFGQTPTT